MRPSYPSSKKIERHVRLLALPRLTLPKISYSSSATLRRACIVTPAVSLVLAVTTMDTASNAFRFLTVSLAYLFAIALRKYSEHELAQRSYGEAWRVDWQAIDQVARTWGKLIEQPILSHFQAIHLANELLFIMHELEQCETWQLQELQQMPQLEMVWLAIELELFRRSERRMIRNWKVWRGFKLLAYRYYATEENRPAALRIVIQRLGEIRWYRPSLNRIRRTSSLLLGIDFGR